MNRSLKSTSAFFFAAALFGAGSALAHEGHDHAKEASAAAKAAYPMTTCVVSGDKLEENNSMGGPVDYFYKVAGQPDRLVRFCCKDCVKDFEKEPAKYLKLLDEAAAAKAKPAAK